MASGNLFPRSSPLHGFRVKGKALGILVVEKFKLEKMQRRTCDYSLTMDSHLINEVFAKNSAKETTTQMKTNNEQMVCQELNDKMHVNGTDMVQNAT